MKAHVLQHPLDKDMVIDPLLHGEAAKFLLFEGYRSETRGELVLLFQRLQLADAAAHWMEEYDIPQESLVGGGLMVVEREEPTWRVAMEFGSQTLMERFRRDRPGQNRMPQYMDQARTAVTELLDSVLRQR